MFGNLEAATGMFFYYSKILKVLKEKHFLKELLQCLTKHNLSEFDDYSPCKANRIFLTLHGCMKEVMKVGGGNNYDIPHIRKEMLERQGHLPIQLRCDAALVNLAMAQITNVWIVSTAL
jgi:hypothetical protein